jgi:uroporphyrinogen decarboxylase
VTGAERLIAACRGEPVDTTPVWFMRQAGGSLPGYLALRERYSVLEIAKSPELCAEVTVLAADTLGTDGAVMFADVMLPVEAMGVALSLAPTGPVIEHPIRTEDDVAGLRQIDPATDLGFLLEAIGRVRRAVGERAAVIGLAGGPFTIAAYLIEGGPSRDQLAAKRLMFGAPALWAALLDRITDATVAYVEAQVRAGAQVIQLFDSWAGSLGPDDYDRSVAPWTARILTAVRAAGVPVIHFAASGSALLERLAAGADVVGVDSGQSLATARERLPGTAVQGNLDPARLAAGWDAVTQGADAVLAANAGRPGHIFNTGHAVPRDTSPELLRDLVAFVHDRGAATARPLVTSQGTTR